MHIKRADLCRQHFQAPGLSGFQQVSSPGCCLHTHDTPVFGVLGFLNQARIFKLGQQPGHGGRSNLFSSRQFLHRVRPSKDKH